MAGSLQWLMDESDDKEEVDEDSDDSEDLDDADRSGGGAWDGPREAS